MQIFFGTGCQKQNDCKSLKVSSNFLDKCKSDFKIRRQNKN